MTLSIAHVPWLNDPATKAVMAALEAAAPGGSRFVGGCVRNAIIGRAADDIDIATVMRPEDVITAVEAAGLRSVPTGIEHGTVTVIAERRPFEVTTLRRDLETDGRRAVVAFTDNWAEDAARRDFRLNALYADPAGAVFDPVGGGAEDARAGRVVFIGRAEDRIREDYLRILRFFRFHAWYGRGPLDADGLAACAALRDGLAQLSVERIWKELRKLLAAPDPRASLAGMEAAGLDAFVWPEAARRERLVALIGLEEDAFLPADPLTRLAAALPNAAAARSLAVRLKLSNEERARLVDALTPQGRIVSYLSLLEMRRTLYRLGRTAFEDQVKIAWAEDANPRTLPQWRALLALAAGWVRPTLPLDGTEVMAAGVPPGPKVGIVMREVEAWWIDADFPDDKLSIVERLKAVAQALA